MKIKMMSVVIWALGVGGIFCLIAGCSFFNIKEPEDAREEVRLDLNKKRVYIGYPPFKLSGGIPSGGSYSGPGVTNGKFYPEKAGTGHHSVSYCYGGHTASDEIEVVGPKIKVPDPNCPYCHGSGKVYCNPRITCTECRGNGKIWDHTCSDCDGTGKVRAWYKAWLGKKHVRFAGGLGQYIISA